MGFNLNRPLAVLKPLRRIGRCNNTDGTLCALKLRRGIFDCSVKNNSRYFSSMRLQSLSYWPLEAKRSLVALLGISNLVSATVYYPEPPDTKTCSQFLGRPLDRSACQAAVDNIPRGDLPSIFTTRSQTATNNYVEVPVRYTDSDSDPRCVVTIDLDGHSQRDQFVFVPYDQVRVMAQRIVDFCVGIFDRGGFMTYGVGRTLEALITPTAYSGGNTDIPTPAYVEQPDESVGLGIVAVPSNQDTGAAYSESDFFLCDAPKSERPSPRCLPCPFELY